MKGLAVLDDILLPFGVASKRALNSIVVFREVGERHCSLNPVPAGMVDHSGHALPDVDGRRAVEVHNDISIHWGSPSKQLHGESAPQPNSLQRHNSSFPVNPPLSRFALTQISRPAFQVAG